VILVSWLSFRFIEQPFLRIKNRLGRKRERAPTPAKSLPEREPAR
jgi:hypothetical protein